MSHRCFHLTILLSLLRTSHRCCHLTIQVSLLRMNLQSFLLYHFFHHKDNYLI
jgi:hypothetical protein